MYVQKKLIVSLFIFFTAVSTFLLYPVDANAVTFSDISDYVFLLDEETQGNTKENASLSDPSDLDLLDDYNKDQNCTGSDSILGDPNDENSVAWLLQQALNYIKIIGPILVVVLSSIDFAGVVVKGDDDAMAKAKKKLVTRLILAAWLFFIPVFVEAILDMFGITAEATCGLN